MVLTTAELGLTLTTAPLNFLQSTMQMGQFRKWCLLTLVLELLHSKVQMKYSLVSTKSLSPWVSRSTQTWFRKTSVSGRMSPHLVVKPWLQKHLWLISTQLSLMCTRQLWTFLLRTKMVNSAITVVTLNTSLLEEISLTLLLTLQLEWLQLHQQTGLVVKMAHIRTLSEDL
jgi:hypothetical protein